jgi:hypothetical protein
MRDISINDITYCCNINGNVCSQLRRNVVMNEKIRFSFMKMACFMVVSEVRLAIPQQAELELNSLN